MIEPKFMGIWAAMTIFETYASVLGLGVTNGMNRELPFSMGEGKKDLAILYAQTTLAYSMFTTLILWLLVPFILHNFELDKYYLMCFGVNITRVSLSFYTNYLSGTFRTTDNFNKYSNLQFIKIASNLLLTPLIYFYNFNGYLAMQLVLVILEAILLHLYRPLHVKPKFDFSAFKRLVKVGFPLFVTGYFVSFIETIPKLFIIKYSDETHLGLYTPVLMLISTFALLPKTLNTYYYPKLSFHFGKTGNTRDLWKSMKKIYSFSFIALIPIILIAFFLLDELISFFPKYEQSLPYLKIALFVAPFVLSKLGNLINVILMKVNYMVLYVIIYGISQVGFIIITYTFFTKDVLLAAVWSNVLTNIVLFILSIFFNFKLATTRQ